MSSITASTDFDRIEETEELPKFLSKFGEQVVQTVNGQLDFQTNFNCRLLSVTFSAANTDTTLNHGLNRVPTGYLVYSLTASMIVYNGSQTSTATTLYLRASATGTAGVIVF